MITTSGFNCSKLKLKLNILFFRELALADRTLRSIILLLPGFSFKASLEEERTTAVAPFDEVSSVDSLKASGIAAGLAVACSALGMLVAV